MRFKKIVRYIHLWLGLTSGLVVLILGLTGCIYCFQKEIKDRLYKDRLYVAETGPGRALPVDSLLAKANAFLGKDLPVTSVELYADRRRTYHFTAFKINEKAWNYFSEFESYRSVYINPYTAKVQYADDERADFFHIILELHYSLLLSSYGQFVVRWGTVLFVIMLISGIILWWPKNKAASKQRFWFAWKKSTRFRRKNYDLHNIPGFYVLFFTLAIGLTGMVFGFPWARKAAGWLGNGGKEVKADIPFFSDTTDTRQTAGLQQMVDEVFRLSPQTKTLFVRLPDQKAAPVELYAFTSIDQFYKRDEYSFDRYKGNRLQQKPYTKMSNGERLQNMNYDIHVGSIGGLAGEIIAFIASLVAASLPVTGLLIWWGKRKKTGKLAEPSIRREIPPPVAPSMIG